MKEKGFYNVEEIQQILECGKSKAYQVVQQLNKARKEKGLLIITGRIPVTDFNRVFYGD